MATTDIITGRYVSITQTPAGLADRIIGRIIDMVAIVVYLISMTYLILEYISSSLSDVMLFLMLALAVLPVVFYSFLCETFFHGQSLGKRIMKMRVVKADGSTPGVGDFLLRWMLLMIDLHFSCIGILPIICTRRNQRFGDLAAGTIVIKLQEYKKLHVSLDEFGYARRDYRPVYPEAARLSLGQADVISKTLYGSANFNAEQAARLSAKIQTMLGIKPSDGNDVRFLETLLHDYHYYALEMI